MTSFVTPKPADDKTISKNEINHRQRVINHRTKTINHRPAKFACGKLRLYFFPDDKIGNEIADKIDDWMIK